MRFFERFSIQGLSGDATIRLEDSRTIRLFNLKTKKIRSLPGGLVPDKDRYPKDATMVGNGFTITYEMLESLPATRPGAGRRSTQPGGWAARFGLKR